MRSSESLFSSLSNISDSCEPRNMDMIAGGASLAPRRWAFVADIIEAFNSPLWRCTAAIVLATNVINCRLSFGVLPGAYSSTPLSVPRLQLLCLPEPLMPANGFSWRSTRKLWRRATSAMSDISSRLWSLARLVSSNMGASSNWLGATSLWRVLAGMPSLWHSISRSSMKDSTREGMAPK